MEQSVLFEVKDGVATLSLNRPDSLNSYNKAMSKSLLAYSETIRISPDIKMVVFKGEGRAFMSGGDVNYFKENMATLDGEIRQIIRSLGSTILNFRQCDKPILAVVHGACAGAGLSLMLASDLVIATKETTLTTAYSALGTSPDGGMSYFLPQLVGSKKAFELMALTSKFSANEAKALGIVNEVVEPEGLADSVATWTSRVMAMSKDVLKSVKHLTYSSFNQSLAEQLESEASYFFDMVKTDNFKEGVNAFLEKRKPNFS